MDGWHLFLYAIAALLALQSLVSLMTNHKRQFAKELVAREEARRKTAAGAKSRKENKEEQDGQADQVAA